MHSIAENDDLGCHDTIASFCSTLIGGAGSTVFMCCENKTRTDITCSSTHSHDCIRQWVQLSLIRSSFSYIISESR